MFSTGTGPDIHVLIPATKLFNQTLLETCEQNGGNRKGVMIKIQLIIHTSRQLQPCGKALISHKRPALQQKDNVRLGSILVFSHATERHQENAETL